MLLANAKVTCTTNNTCFTAIYKRIYFLTVHAQCNNTALVTVASEDYVPSGYMRGGSRRVLLESTELDLTQYTAQTAKQLLAQLALQHGTDLAQLNDSCTQIKTHLEMVSTVS